MTVSAHNPDQYMASLRQIIAQGRKRSPEGQGAQPLTARTTWYVEGNNKTASPTPLRYRQAARAGAKSRRRQGPKPHCRDSARSAGQRRDAQ